MSTTAITQTYSFLPTSLNGCVLWLDGSDLSTLFTDIGGTTPVSASGQSVANWKDKSSSANHATNATNQPTVTYNSQNGLPAVTFNGSSQFLNLTPSKLPIGPTNFSYFFVVKTTSSAVQVFMTNGSTAVFGQMPQFYFSNFLLAGDLFGASGINDAVVYNNTFTLATYTSDSTFRGYSFGNTFSGSPNSASVTLNTGVQYAFLGVSRLQNGSAVFFLNGQIAEVIVYNRVVSSTEQQQIEGYLGWKWGVQTKFSASFAYRNNGPFMNVYPLPVSITAPQSARNNLLFLPTMIANCQLWFDASDPTTLSVAGSNITQWRDKSSNAYSIGQSSAALQPFYSLQAQNGLNGVQLTTERYIFTEGSNIPNFTTGNATSVFMVARNASTNDSWNIINTIWFTGINPGTQRYHFSFNQNATDGTTLYMNSVLVGQVTSNAVAPLSNAILGFTASPSSATIHTNGSSDTYAGVTLPNANNGTYFIFGDARNSVASSNIMIFEMVGYNSQLTLSQRQQIEGYMAWKWGIQANLPSSHPYKNSPYPGISSAPNPVYPPQIRSSFWQPSQLSGLTLWLDAADPSTIGVSGTTVTSVTDKSSSPKSITVTNTVSYVSKQALVFTNSSGVLNVSGMPAAPYDILTVATANSVTNIYRTLLRTSSAPGVHPILLQLNTDNLGMWDSTNFFQFGSLTMATNEKALVYASMALNRTIQAAKNGTIELTGPSPPGNESIITLIGNSTGGGQPWGTLQEIVIYTQTLTRPQRQQVEGYLAWKWGLQSSLPGNHPYRLFPPAP